METYPRYWSFVRGIHRPRVYSAHRGQWRGALMFSLICAWINGLVNNRDAGDLRRLHAHYDATVMNSCLLFISQPPSIVSLCQNNGQSNRPNKYCGHFCWCIGLHKRKGVVRRRCRRFWNDLIWLEFTGRLVLKVIAIRVTTVLTDIGLTRWGRDKMAAIFPDDIFKCIFLMTEYGFRIKFHWSLLLRVQLTISQHWLNYGLAPAGWHLNQWWISLLTYICVNRPLWINTNLSYARKMTCLKFH